MSGDLLIYCDASMAADGRAGIGYVVADPAAGKVTEHRARVTARSSMSAEALAVGHSADRAAELRRSAVILTDCEHLELAVNRPGSLLSDAWLEVAHWLRQRLHDQRCRLERIVGHSGNLGNTRADQLAYAAAHGTEPPPPAGRCPTCNGHVSGDVFRRHLIQCPAFTAAKRGTHWNEADAYRATGRNRRRRSR